MKKQIKKKTNKSNEKEYNHLAISQESKARFDKLRFKLIGEKGQEVTHDILLNILLDNYKK